MQFYTCVNRWGNKLLYRGYDNGRPVAYEVPFEPTIYQAVNWKTEIIGMDGRFVEPKSFQTMRDCTDHIKMYTGVGGKKMYGNKNYINQFLTEKFPNDIEFDRDSINVTSIDIEVASDDGFPEPDEAAHPIISITMKNNIDNTFYVWGLGDYNVESSYMKEHRVVYKKCDTEVQLLSAFLVHWNKHSPDVVTGWNTEYFDIPYIVHRIANVMGSGQENLLSPWKKINQRKRNFKGMERTTYEIFGMASLDYMTLFKKFGYSYGPQESYSLNNIANVVLGEKKLSYEEHSNLHTLYLNDHQKFIDYNIRDVELVDRIEDKMGLITLVMTIAYKAGINYNDTLGTTSMWDTIIYRRLMGNRVKVIPPIDQIEGDPTFEPNKNYHKKHDTKTPNAQGSTAESTSKSSGFAGGYVKDPQVGLHDWVCSFDLNSLYPNIIVQWNMSPETILPERTGGVHPDAILEGRVRNADTHSLAGNGVHFSNDRRGIIPSIIVDYYAERAEIKKKMLEAKQAIERADKGDKQNIYRLEREINRLENQQMAIKIMMNSLYGALGNKYFKYFDLRMAEAVTLTGQTCIRWAEETVNAKLNSVLKTQGEDYVIAIDTDSLYVNFGPVVKAVGQTDMTKNVNALDSFCKDVIEPVIEKAYAELHELLGSYDNRMVMAREAIADVGIWTAKKRYILNVHDNEGVRYAEPKLKIMGIEAIKSSTPAEVRQALKEIFKVIVTGSETKTQDAIAQFKTYFMALPPEEVSFPRSVSDIDKWSRKRSEIYAKGTPIHVRGAILHNHHLSQMGLDKKYSAIKSGDKIKFCYLKMPNPIRENVISFTDYLPEELQLHKYVDKKVQFEKTFLDVITPILESIGWEAEERATLDAFFA